MVVTASNLIYMKSEVYCFIAEGRYTDLVKTISELRKSELVRKIFVLHTHATVRTEIPEGVEIIETDRLTSTLTMRKIADKADGNFIFLYTKSYTLQPGPWAIERMVQAANDVHAGMVYSDHYVLRDEHLLPNPVIDYQHGSLRDDFNFGSCLLFRAQYFKESVSLISDEFQFAGLYDIRLKVSQNHRIIRLPEYLYTEVETDLRNSGEKQFDYVDPKNREVQVEMEKACTRHLKDIGGWLKPKFREIDLSFEKFPVEASVIIPVRNRARTIGDAVRSVLSQTPDFPFNIIVVDNHSTDGTTDILKQIVAEDQRLIHLIPERNDLGIGGCWTFAIMDHRCGRFAIQLDSDDLYIDSHVVGKIVETFYRENCAMVVGSYQMVNFKLEEIPPGLIDHKEWTPDNGRNNALRINGLGAPRAFFTPVLREVKIPNVSYGEDYAVGLRISRDYKIGRIYESLYLCRRWDENSDAALSIEKLNHHNLYKDRIRTLELFARQELNR